MENTTNEWMPYRVIAPTGDNLPSWDTWTADRLARKVIADLDAEFPESDDQELNAARETITSFLGENHRRNWADAVRVSIRCFTRRNELRKADGETLPF